MAITFVNLVHNYHRLIEWPFGLLRLNRLLLTTVRTHRIMEEDERLWRTGQHRAVEVNILFVTYPVELTICIGKLQSNYDTVLPD